MFLSGGAPGAQVVEGTGVTECSLPWQMFRHGFCRVTVEDAAGGRAWTNPIHFTSPTIA